MAASWHTLASSLNQIRIYNKEKIAVMRLPLASLAALMQTQATTRWARAGAPVPNCIHGYLYFHISHNSANTTFALTSDGLNCHNFNTSARQNHQATLPFKANKDQP